MSGILALIGQVRESRVETALAPLRYLGGEQEQVWSEGDAFLVVTRKEWQLGDDFSGNILVLETPDLVVAADASLYDKKGLARRLSTAGVRALGETASHYLEAAYRAWGPEMVHHLNGDYAFVIWDRRARRLLAARDPIGGRSLYFARIGSGIAIASSCRAVAELRGTSRDLNLTNLGGLVAGLAWSNGIDTAYAGVDTLLPGHRLTWNDDFVAPEAFWRPAPAPDRRPLPFEEAAAELREILSTATLQRCGTGISTVWLSGGWDSTAVFGAGQHALGTADRSRLRPVSISYPEGDPGHEDGYIRQVAEHWHSDVHWLKSQDLGLLEGFESRAAERDEPPAHLYELWNRGLARGTRALGSRIALDGGGGDQLFQVSDIFMADDLRAGRLFAFAKMARARRSNGWRYVVGRGILPLLPLATLRAAEGRVHPRVPRHYLERNLTDWIRPDFERAHRLRERDLAVLHSLRGKSLAQTENMLYLTMPIWSCGGSYMKTELIQEGVESRSPLLDMRVVEYALRRPIAERSDGVETKRLLRRAMEGLLPPKVLAPRSHRTGLTVGFSRQRMRDGYPALLSALLDQPLRLAELGVVDAGMLRKAADRYLAGDRDEYLRMNLFYTMKTEFWLRGLDQRSESARSSTMASSVEAELPAA